MLPSVSRRGGLRRLAGAALLSSAAARATDAVRSYMGDARGRWESDTLVVETTNFNGRTGSYGRNGNGNPTRRQLRLIERFRLAGANARLRALACSLV